MTLTNCEKKLVSCDPLFQTTSIHSEGVHPDKNKKSIRKKLVVSSSFIDVFGKNMGLFLKSTASLCIVWSMSLLALCRQVMISPTRDFCLHVVVPYIFLTFRELFLDIFNPLPVTC